VEELGIDREVASDDQGFVWFNGGKRGDTSGAVRACPMALGLGLGPELGWIFKKGANGAVKWSLNLQSSP
jgi:hypothetical protein